VLNRLWQFSGCISRLRTSVPNSHLRFCGAHRIVPFACSPGSPPMWHQQHQHQLTSGQSRLCNKLQSTFDLDLTPESHHHFLITCILCHEAIWNGIILVGAPSPRGFGGEHVAQPRSRAVKIPPKAPGYFLLSQVRCRHRDQIQLASAPSRLLYSLLFVLDRDRVIDTDKFWL